MAVNSNCGVKRNAWQQRFFTSLFAGGLGGAVAKSVIAPLDRTKIYFQVTNKPFSFFSALRFLRTSMNQEGILALWKGNSATMARIVPYSAITFAAHEQYKWLLGVDQMNSRAESSDSAHLLSRRFICGSLAGVTAVTITYPLDSARARMAVTKRFEYRTLLGTFKTTISESGLIAIYRGFWPTLMGVIPYSGTSFFVYGTLKKYYTRLWPDSSPGYVHMLMGALAGTIGQCSSYPLDIVRRRHQTAGMLSPERAAMTPEQISRSGVWTTLVHVYRTEGLIHGCYKGLSMNFVKGPVATGVSFMVFETTKPYLNYFFKG